MASFLNIISKLFGNKYDKDIKEITPIVEEINKQFDILSGLSNDQLRGKTQDFKKQIQDYVAIERTQIKDLKEKSQKTTAQEKEDLYKEIDSLEKVVLEKIEIILNNILPEAFAVVKETARRFSTNESLEVLATENDKELATVKDFISINGEKAIYQTSWDAAGTSIKWDMILMMFN